MTHTPSPATQAAIDKFGTQENLDRARGLRRAQIVAELVLTIVEQAEAYGWTARDLRMQANRDALAGERETCIARRIVATEIEHSA